MLQAELLEQIDEKYRDHPSLKDFDNVGALAKSYVETKAMIGNSMRIPSEDAGPEAYSEFINSLVTKVPTVMVKPDFTEPKQSDEFYATMGVPDDMAKYENPEDTALIPDVEAEIRAIALKAKMTPFQYKTFIAELATREAETTTNLTAKRDGDFSALAGKWGTTHDARIEAAKKTNEEYFPGRPFEQLNTAEIEGLYAISESVTGKGATVATQAGGEISTGMTPAEATERAAEIMKRIHNPNSGLSHDEKIALSHKRIDLLVKHAGMEGSLDSLKA